MASSQREEIWKRQFAYLPLPVPPFLSNIILMKQVNTFPQIPSPQLLETIKMKMEILPKHILMERATKFPAKAYFPEKENGTKPKKASILVFMMKMAIR